MTNYKTATHQNLSVWARRLGMEIVDLDKGAAFADNLFKQPSRRGVLIALGILHIAKTNRLPMADEGMITTGIAMGNVLYDRVYGEQKYEDINAGFRDEVLAQAYRLRVTMPQAYDLMAFHYATALDWVTRGIASRNAEHSPASIVNAILAKIRR